MIKTNLVSFFVTNHKSYILWHELYTHNTCFKGVYVDGRAKCHGIYLWNNFSVSDITWEYINNLSNPRKYTIINISTEMLFMNIL